MLLNKLLSQPSFTGSQAVILNMQHDRSSEATTVAAADCCFILQPVLRRFPSLSHRYSRLFLLPIIGQGLRCSSFDFIHSNISWSGFSLTLPHSIWAPRFPLVAARSNASFYFYFYFSRVWQKCLLKGLFNSNGFLYGANLHLHSLTRSWIILWP